MRTEKFNYLFDTFMASLFAVNPDCVNSKKSVSYSEIKTKTIHEIFKDFSFDSMPQLVNQLASDGLPISYSAICNMNCFDAIVSAINYSSIDLCGVPEDYISLYIVYDFHLQPDTNSVSPLVAVPESHSDCSDGLDSQDSESYDLNTDLDALRLKYPDAVIIGIVTKPEFCKTQINQLRQTLSRIEELICEEPSGIQAIEPEEIPVNTGNFHYGINRDISLWSNIDFVFDPLSFEGPDQGWLDRNIPSDTKELLAELMGGVCVVLAQTYLNNYDGYNTELKGDFFIFPNTNKVNKDGEIVINEDEPFYCIRMGSLNEQQLVNLEIVVEDILTLFPH
jgi:hypothetical protein